MYYQGWGVPQDYVEAVWWFRKAAEQGDLSAEFTLARRSIGSTKSLPSHGAEPRSAGPPCCLGAPGAEAPGGRYRPDAPAIRQLLEDPPRHGPKIRGSPPRRRVLPLG
jgi:Sel1 repeat-containing protein